MTQLDYLSYWKTIEAPLLHHFISCNERLVQLKKRTELELLHHIYFFPSQKGYKKEIVPNLVPKEKYEKGMKTTRTFCRKHQENAIVAGIDVSIHYKKDYFSFTVKIVSTPDGIVKFYIHCASSEGIFAIKKSLPAGVREGKFLELTDFRKIINYMNVHIEALTSEVNRSEKTEEVETYADQVDTTG